jgi:hypothetical protein
MITTYRDPSTHPCVYTKRYGNTARLRLAVLTIAKLCIPGILALVTFSQAHAASSIVLEVTNHVTLGALQVAISYGDANGEFRGSAADVDCEDLSGADTFVVNDDDANAILRLGFISIGGVDAPTQVASCVFDAMFPPVSSTDFQLEIVDASDPSISPVAVTARLVVDDCSPSGAQCGDVNSDGGLTASDALLVLNAAVGLPAQLNCSGVPTSGTTTTTTTTTITTTTTTTTTTTISMPVLRRLRLFKEGTGSGTVTSTPAGINCGADCEEFYDDGTSVTLTATPGGSATFVGWSGGVPNSCQVGGQSCAFKMGRNRNVTARFDVNATVTQLRFGNDLACNSGGDFTVQLAANGRTWKSSSGVYSAPQNIPESEVGPQFVVSYVTGATCATSLLPVTFHNGVPFQLPEGHLISAVFGLNDSATGFLIRFFDDGAVGSLTMQHTELFQLIVPRTGLVGLLAR